MPPEGDEKRKTKTAVSRTKCNRTKCNKVKFLSPASSAIHTLHGDLRNYAGKIDRSIHISHSTKLS